MAEMTLTPSALRSTDRAADVEGAPAVSSWQRWAACRNVPTRVFFPAGHFARMEEKQAKAVCLTCPVRLPCLAFAVEHDEVGVWGALNEHERRRLAAQDSAS
jgi:WhiB family redox-sensing transcriptional regulator